MRAFFFVYPRNQPSPAHSFFPLSKLKTKKKPNPPQNNPKTHHPQPHQPKPTQKTTTTCARCAPNEVNCLTYPNDFCGFGPVFPRWSFPSLRSGRLFQERVLLLTASRPHFFFWSFLRNEHLSVDAAALTSEFELPLLATHFLLRRKKTCLRP